jgi:superfamily II DNA or RNA helicase
MPQRTSKSGSDLFIVDNSDTDWKVLRYLHDWCQISKAIDIATGYFEIGSLLSLQDEWQKVDAIRILMGDEVSYRTRSAFAEGLARIRARLECSLEKEKEKNDFLEGVPAVVDAIRSGKILCRVYRKEKFHAKAYLTHARLEVVGSSALVGSSNFTYPGLTENIELNVQITGRPVGVLQEWYEEHWDAAEDVTPEILRVIERHTRDYTPFEVYAKALHEYCRQEEISDTRWLEQHSRVYPVLDRYQKEGFHKLIAIADEHRGAFLCDGVGLGKTFIGLMVIEYLVERLRKRVVLLVPKAGREPVWEQALRQYLPHLAGGDFSNLAVFNHTDLQRGGNFPARLERIKEMADAVLIDEAHHFRNPGQGGDGRGIQPEAPRAPSRYRRLYDLLDGPTGCKQLFLLTATPVNNRLIDLQHMIELFSRRLPDYFKSKVGIHSLPGHFRKMEKDLLQATNANGAEPVQTDLFEAEQVLAGDALFQALVVQRSRAYVRESQLQQGGSLAIFPTRENPKVADYDLKKTYGRLLEKVEQAFAKEKPLFSLAIYYPLAYYTGDDERIDKFVENRQQQIVGLIRTQFLKRFESSAHAFACSCDRLLVKLLAFATKHSDAPVEQRRLERWKIRHKDLIGYVHERQLELFGSEEDDEGEEDLVSEEMLEAVAKLPEEQYDIGAILNETYNDLDQIIEFLHELRKFEAKHDDKLKALANLLKKDPVLSKHKVLIFTEFADTARYLKQELTALGITGIDQIDSDTKRDRGDVIRAFAPYYNGTTSARLDAAGKTETRILISTDVLSEGLNLQDATRLINYDIHWNPVRLMQRIGRVDRRLNPQVEEQLVADHPDQKPLRGSVAYWNFLPPDELNDLLRLYQRVAHKTLRISRTFGIEGQKLLTPDDDYEALRNFNHAYEGTPTPAENMHLEYQRLLREFPDLAERLDALPGRVFSGKAQPAPATRAVFVCYALPAVVHGALTEEPVRQGSLFGAVSAEPIVQQGLLSWTEAAGRTAWYLYDLAADKILDDATAMLDLIRCRPETARHCVLEQKTLKEIRAKVEKHIDRTYMKSLQAPQGVKPSLKAWMELS